MEEFDGLFHFWNTADSVEQFIKQNDRSAPAVSEKDAGYTSRESLTTPPAKKLPRFRAPRRLETICADQPVDSKCEADLESKLTPALPKKEESELLEASVPERSLPNFIDIKSPSSRYRAVSVEVEASKLYSSLAKGSNLLLKQLFIQSKTPIGTVMLLKWLLFEIGEFLKAKKTAMDDITLEMLILSRSDPKENP